MTPWLVHGLEIVCLDARHARAALNMQISKTDQNDAVAGIGSFTSNRSKAPACVFFWAEGHWRTSARGANSAAGAGLAPSPWASGSVSWDQGITQAEPPLLPAQMMRITWRWLFWQPESGLTLWFRKRTEGATRGMRRVMAVALARNLLIALWRWRYATTGLVPQGAVVICYEFPHGSQPSGMPGGCATGLFLG